MRLTPAGAVGVALPVACVAPPARDTRAPLARIALRTLCLSAGARSHFGTYLWVDGRGAGDRALGTRAATTAGTGCAPVARWGFTKVGGGWLATLLRITPPARTLHEAHAGGVSLPEPAGKSLGGARGSATSIDSL